MREPVSDIRRVGSDLRDAIWDKGFRQGAFRKMCSAISEVRKVVWVTLGDDQEEGDRFSRHPNVDVMCQISVLSL
jgi:hypothetical protein